MNDTRNVVIVILAVALIAAGGGYLMGRERAPIATPTGTPLAATDKGPPIYYQDPDGKPDYSPSPRKTPDGRDYKPVYDQASTATAPSAPQGRDRILYYRNPMGQPDTSPVPKKDSMGMDYIPVYENEAGADATIVRVNPQRVQMLGVRTAPAEMRRPLARTIRTTGTVQFDERRLATVSTKAGGWIEKLNVAATGDTVHAGQPLLEIYSPDLMAAEQDYLVVASMPSQSATAHGDSASLVEASLRRLRALDVPEGEIARLRRSEQTSRRIAVLAPANGVVTEKNAVLGMRVEPGTALYKTADLSTVWLIAQVHEQDLGRVRPGQKASAMFVAFPDRVFEGTVDFVYPTLAPDTRTAKVRIVISNSGGLLRSEMYATVDIDPASSTVASVIAVPNSAIIDSGAHQAVLVAKGEGRFEPRAVRVGARDQEYTEILEGLKEGEQVVTGANFLIDAESNLRAALQAFTPEQKSGGTAQ